MPNTATIQLGGNSPRNLVTAEGKVKKGQDTGDSFLVEMSFFSFWKKTVWGQMRRQIDYKFTFVADVSLLLKRALHQSISPFQLSCKFPVCEMALFSLNTKKKGSEPLEFFLNFP